MSGWWYVAGASFIISAAVWRRISALLSAANPSAYLPWFGWPPNRPRGIRPLQFLACFSISLAVSFSIDAVGDHHLYNVLWGTPAIVGVFMIGVAIPYHRHNRRVRRTGLSVTG